MSEAKLSYVTGDATQPVGSDEKVIIHVCNNLGVWGAGFVLALSDRWPIVEERYRNIDFYELGTVQFVQAEQGITIANMIAQHAVGGSERPPIRYGALSRCLVSVRSTLLYKKSIHAPRFGAGLAGGHWPTIESLILEELVDYGIDVTIYDLPQGV